MEPLEGIDAAFLALETPTSHLHVAAVLILDPPEGKRSLFSPSTRFAQIRRVVTQRIHLVPQLRQRAVHVPLGLHHPVWADDPAFDLDEHLSRASVPSPGGPREVDDLVADIMGRPLDPDRPLWEIVVVEGLAEGRSALVAKLHHAILDGTSGASLLGAFLDLNSRERAVPTPEEPWMPEPLPSSADLLRYAAGSFTHTPGVVVDAIQRGIEAVADVGAHNRHLAEQGDEPPPSLFSAPRTSLNGTISSRRRFATVSLPLEDAKLVRRVFGATVNDVVLAGVAGGVRRLLSNRGEVPDKSLVALVPVSTRPVDEASSLGNKVSGMCVSLASDIADPVERLLTIAHGTQVAKAQERLTGGRWFEDVARIAPPAVASRAIRWASGLKLFDRFPPPFNLVVSSVPGPDFSLWCAGSRVVALHPVGPIGEGTGLNVTAMSYLDTLYFGLLGCRRLVPDVQDLGIMVDDAMGELVAAALDAQGAVS